jgi:pimeloyl-ACP methyl ester carboxylesterase
MARDPIHGFSRGLSRTARLALAAWLLGGTGCQSVAPTSREKTQLRRTLAALETPPPGTPAAPVALRNYRRAVADVLPSRLPQAAGEPEHLLRPVRVHTGFWHWLRPPARTAGLHRESVGLPVVETLVPGGANAPRHGYLVPTTALAWIDPHRPDAIAVELLDPRRIDSVKLGGRKMPLAMDLEAPLDSAKMLGPRPLDGLLYMLQTSRFNNAPLVFLEPYAPRKIPVVLIHGLLSTPRMWTPVVKALLASEAIRQRYQFWFFYYPTGQPIPLSAMQLRESLDEARRVHHVRTPLVLIGHSMGGILARAQITGITPAEADKILPGVSSLPADNRVRKALAFPPRRDVARAIFIATPHRGSNFALNGIAGLGIRLIRLPLWIQTELTTLAELPFTDRSRRFPTSICGLSPNSRFLRALDQSTSNTPVHSIIPVLGRRPLEQSSDGVVAYPSAHLPEAVSEVVVSAGHGGFDHPQAIEEIARILLASPRKTPHHSATP